MNLRMSIEFPRNPSAWKGVGLRFLNVLLLGCVVIFFVNRRMVRAEKKGTMPTAARSGILRSLLWQFTGLALVGASFGSQGELFRGLLVLGSILVIGGEMTLAWGMRCFILDKKMGLTPLWPMYLASSLGILISYPNLPGGILSLSWIAVGLVSLYILKELHARELPGIENNLLHVHRLTVWLSMAVAAIGWPRMAILVLILVDCLAINTQFIIGLLQILNRSSDVQDSEQHAQRSVLAGLVAAFIAPIVLLLILCGMVLWVIAMPGGALLLWHYLGTGVQVGSASFNMVHLILIVSVFYITRAAITASRSFLNRVASQSYKIDKTLIPPMQTGITYGLWTLFALFTLKALGFGLENLAVIAGGLSVGIGFGMQTIVNNFLSGLILHFQPDPARRRRHRRGQPAGRRPQDQRPRDHGRNVRQRHHLCPELGIRLQPPDQLDAQRAHRAPVKWPSAWLTGPIPSSWNGCWLKWRSPSRRLYGGLSPSSCSWILRTAR